MPNDLPFPAAPLPNVIEVDVRVVISARIQTLAGISDAQLSQAVLAQLAILAPFAARVQSISVERAGLVGVAGNAPRA